MLTILHRDEHLVAIDKPSGWLVHRSNLDRHETRLLVQALRDQIGRPVYPAHRLDKGTSGVLLFALDPATAAALGRQFEAGTVRKTYLAVVRGWPPESGRIDHPLSGLVDTYGNRPAVLPQPAVTDYRRLATVELPFAVDRYPTSRYALLALEPHTGRRHQLRRHLKHVAHPIIGDATHGKGIHNRFFQACLGSDRLLLACLALEFAHPRTLQPMNIGTPLDPGFAALIDRLGWTMASRTELARTNPALAGRRFAPGQGIPGEIG